MLFYEIRLRSVPKIRFACTVCTEHYKNHFRRFPTLLEVCVCLEGRIRMEHADGTQATVEPGMMAPTTRLMDCKTYALHGERQKHITVGVDAEYDCLLHDTESFARGENLRESLSQGNVFLIPYQWHLEHRQGEVVESLKKIECLFRSGKEPDGIHALAEWFFLTARLTEIVLSELNPKVSGLSPMAVRYVSLAKEYVERTYQRDVSVQEIAQAVGISAGYLHGIFKQAVGRSVLEYRNDYRIRLVQQQIQSHGIPLKDAAELLGIEDVSYMSRLFRKVTGMSYRQYCQRVSESRAWEQEGGTLH